MRLSSNVSIGSLRSLTPLKRKKFNFKTSTNIDPTRVIESFRKILKQKVEARRLKDKLTLNIPVSLNPSPLKGRRINLSPKVRGKNGADSPKIF